MAAVAKAPRAFRRKWLTARVCGNREWMISCLFFSFFLCFPSFYRYIGCLLTRADVATDVPRDIDVTLGLLDEDEPFLDKGRSGIRSVALALRRLYSDLMIEAVAVNYKWSRMRIAV